jgi:EmrB/QacA subfamily drug resistance transporter
MDSRKTFILLSVSCGIFFEALDIAIVNLAIPLIQKDFVLPGDTVQWMQTVYVLFYGGFLILGGKLADTLGRKKIFLIGSGIFLLTSLGAALASSFLILCTARALQGLGAALVMPAAFSIITNTFQEPTERSKALGIFGSFAAIGSGSGLSLGGLIATYFGWQWIFFINVPVITLSMIGAYFMIDADHLLTQRKRIDVLSGIVLTAGILMLTFVVHDLKNLHENYVSLIFLLIMSTLCGWIFMRRSKMQDPLIQFEIFNNPMTLTGNGVMVLMGAFFTGYLFTISMVLQSYMHFSAAKAGLLLVPFSVLSAIVSKSLLPPFLKKIGVVKGAILGMALMSMGAIMLLIAMAFNFSLVLVLVSVACVTGTGIAVCFITLNVIVLQQIPEQHHGLGSSFTNTCFFLGGGMGLSILGVFLPKDPSVFPWVSVMVLGSYAIAGVVWLKAVQSRAFSEVKSHASH